MTTYCEQLQLPCLRILTLTWLVSPIDCVGPDEYVRFDDDSFSTALSQLDQAAPFDPVPSTTPVQLRISPSSPHEFEFPVLKRLKGREYVETGRYFGWKALHTKNPASVRPPPPIPDTYEPRRSPAPLINGAAPSGGDTDGGGQDSELDLDGEPALDPDETKKKREPRTKERRIRGSKKSQKSRSSSSDPPGHQSGLRPTNNHHPAAAPGSLLNRISPASAPADPAPAPAVTNGSTPSATATGAGAKTLSIKGLAANRGRSPNRPDTEPAPSAVPNAASTGTGLSPPKTASRAGSRIRPAVPVPASLPARPPASLSLAPTPISSRPASPPPERADANGTSNGAGAAMTLPSVADLSGSSSLNQITTLLDRLKKREFPSRYGPKDSATGNGVGGAGDEAEWGARGVKASSRPISREPSRPPSPGLGSDRDRKKGSGTTGPSELHRRMEEMTLSRPDAPSSTLATSPPKDESRRRPSSTLAVSPPKQESRRRPSSPTKSPSKPSVPSPLASPPRASTIMSASSPPLPSSPPPPPSNLQPPKSPSVTSSSSSPRASTTGKLDWASLMDDDEEELPDLGEWGFSHAEYDEDLPPVPLSQTSSLAHPSAASSTTTNNFSRPSAQGKNNTYRRGSFGGRTVDGKPGRTPSSQSASRGGGGREAKSSSGRGPSSGAGGSAGPPGGPSAALFGKLARGALAGGGEGAGAGRGSGSGRGGSRRGRAKQ